MHRDFVRTGRRGRGGYTRLGERDGDRLAIDLQRYVFRVIALGRRVEADELAIDIAAEEALLVVADEWACDEIRFEWHRRLAFPFLCAR